MLLVWIGALLIIAGVVLAAVRMIRQGRLSSAKPRAFEATPDTLEPRGRGRRLGLEADLPGIALVAIGSLLLLAAALTR